MKKLVKYEQTTTKKPHSKVRLAPENIINITVIKELSPQKVESPATRTKSINPSDENPIQQSEKIEQADAPAETRQSKRLLRLPKHIKTRNPKIVYKKGIVSDKRNGMLIRNTPTDLYQKYQEDWIKFKAFIPGETNRIQVRRSIRKKMQQKDNDDDAKVSSVLQIFVFDVILMNM